MGRHLALLLVASLALACAKPPYQEPFQATRVAPDSERPLLVDQVVVILDTSGSIDAENDFPAQKAWTESFVAGMPDGNYQAAIVAFGGGKRNAGSLRTFDRSALARQARDLTHLGEGTPLDDVILEVADQLEGLRGNAAVIVVSDGEPTIWGTPRDPARVRMAARDLALRHAGSVCFYSVGVNPSEQGALLLQQIANTTTCGGYRTQAAVDSGGTLYTYQRDVFLGAALPQVAAPLAIVEGPEIVIRGDLGFEFDSAELRAAERRELESVGRLLKENPTARVRIDGHTDSKGSEAYNQGLSERRANAVRDELVGQGVEASRIETIGHGESRPAASNATAQGRSVNRRVEIDLME